MAEQDRKKRRRARAPKHGQSATSRGWSSCPLLSHGYPPLLPHGYTPLLKPKGAVCNHGLPMPHSKTMPPVLLEGPPPLMPRRDAPIHRPIKRSWMPTQPPPFTLPRWVLTYDASTLQHLIQTELLPEPVIGLDIEWKPIFVKGQQPSPVGLIQLASHRIVVLAPVRHLRALPPALLELLVSPRIFKVGCGIKEDATKIARQYGIECASFCDVGGVAERLQQLDGMTFPGVEANQRVGVGLKSLAAAFGQTIAKPKSVSKSNWEARPLSQKQQRYAAEDAYVGLWLASCLHAAQDTELSIGPWLLDQACREGEGEIGACQVAAAASRAADGAPTQKRARL
eukprot:CAMPEP_0183336290 /NCGR_PEP_ID=MMETSP0164_2-20130417/4303_1 /TAXON_ID=221442 /ORGANISM="Coccolithus pelagicus ssp braarudi, Strain PLY182g" /LENGTH=339 /DNA_ID=CAMNT_0025505775 /DNA_START=21 /DNA_END=1040 /DNA_ORIENTATION=+